MYQPRIGSYAVYEPNEEGWHDWEKQIAEMNASLTSRGLEVISAPEAVMNEPPAAGWATSSPGKNWMPFTRS